MQNTFPQKQKRQYSIKIFSDGAEKDSLLKMNQSAIVSGMTTNPSLMKKAGITDYRTFCKDILTQVTQKPISFEVFADDFPEMKRQGLEIASWGQNVYVKIPVMNSRGENTYKLINELSHQGVKLNVTAIFTLEQMHHVCQALKGGAPSIASIFCGRIADTGVDPIPMTKAAVAMAHAVEPNIEVLWASTREVYNIMQADQCGCHIITVPFDILKKLDGLHKDLTSMSLDTVQTFKKDSDQMGFKL